MSYTTDQIFDSPAANSFADILLYELEKYLELTESLLTVDEVMVLSGKAAAILQGETDSFLKNIIFVITEQELLDFFKKATSIPARRASYKEKVLFYTTDAFFEIHLFTDTLNRVAYETIVLQLDTDIPTNLL